MITPSGRFQPHTRLCLSISDYHPNTWNPAWSVSTILTGLLSFMVSDEHTAGSINTSVAVKRRYAAESQEYNLRDPGFNKHFPDLVSDLRNRVQEKTAKTDNIANTAKSQKNNEFKENEITKNINAAPKEMVAVPNKDNSYQQMGLFVVGSVVVILIAFAYL